MLSVQVALPATGRVDRTLSVLLRRHMTQAEWDILCDKFDKELKSGRGRVRRVEDSFLCFLMFTVLTAFLFFFWLLSLD